MRTRVCKRYILYVMLLCALLLPQSICGAEDPGRELAASFETDYIQQIYRSDSGLDGSSANCVFSDRDGLLWIGSYSGLYSFDSREFIKYEIEDFTVAVRCIDQDAAGDLWIGTNGNGIYRFDGRTFESLPVQGEETLMQTVNDLIIDEDGMLWAASGGGILYADVNAKHPEAQLLPETGTDSFRDIDLTGSGGLVCVSRQGKVFCKKDRDSTDILAVTLDGLEAGEKPRCVAVCEDGSSLMIGTNRSRLLIVSDDLKQQEVYEEEKISSVNYIFLIREGCYWICADNGTAVFDGDDIHMVDLDVDNSIEMMCRDYQGEYWFASSRDGLLHLYENYFSDLGSYLKQHTTVNSVMIYHDELYIGADDGLYCYRDGQPVDTELTAFCKGVRVRQLLVDGEERLWAATARYGLVCQLPDGGMRTFSSANSDLTTNDLRCLLQDKEGRMLIGSEDGIFLLEDDDVIRRVVEDEKNPLNTERILCMEETQDGRLYAGTDGDGLYIAEDGRVTAHYTIADGLISNVIMNLRESRLQDGVWCISGAGIGLVDTDGQRDRIRDIPISNSLDMIMLDDGNVVILAGNGFFRLSEDQLLQDEPVYDYYDREHGFPIDVTANAHHLIAGSTLYLCGANGLASLDLERRPPRREIRTYLENVIADGELIYAREETSAEEDHADEEGRTDEESRADEEGRTDEEGRPDEESRADEEDRPDEESRAAEKNILTAKDSYTAKEVFVLQRDAYRLNIHVQLLNYCNDDYQIEFFLEGMDIDPTVIPVEMEGPVSYTNLSGRSYQYRYSVLDKDTGEVLTEEVVRIKKEKKFFEKRSNQIILVILIFAIICEAGLLLMLGRERHIRDDIVSRMTRENQKEIENIVYRDLVTDVYNRNLYELDKQRHMEHAVKMTALVMVSLNHAEYLQKTCGIMHVENLLRRVVALIRENTKEEVRIYRISDYVFLFPCRKSIELEAFTRQIKAQFREQCEAEGEETASIAVGAVYQDKYMEESYQDLFTRCDTMRSLDQKHEEERFIRSKIVTLENATETGSRMD